SGTHGGDIQPHRALAGTTGIGVPPGSGECVALVANRVAVEERLAPIERDKCAATRLRGEIYRQRLIMGGLVFLANSRLERVAGDGAASVSDLRVICDIDTGAAGYPRQLHVAGDIHP